MMPFPTTARFLVSSTFRTTAFPANVSFPETPFLNVQKLSLPANTAVGTRVAVTDGFVVSNWGVGDGFFAPNGQMANGKPVSAHVPNDDLGDGPSHFEFDGTQWVGYNNNTETIIADGLGGNNPWNVTWPAITLTHPAIQQLTAPSTAQGGVFVSGGTQDGVYPFGTWQLVGETINGKQYGNLLGVSDHDPGVSPGFYWQPDPAEWVITTDGGDVLYYSTSNVATPDLATNWKNASDDSLASITVTSVTQGQLVSGWKLGSVVYAVNGAQNGRNLYHDVLGVAADIGWTGVHWTDGTTTGTLNTALPDIGTADVVASEANWQIVP